MVSVYHTFFAHISSSFLYYNVRWIARPASLCNSLKFNWKKKKVILNPIADAPHAYPQ